MHRWLLSFLMLMPVPAVADDLLIGLGYLNGLAGLNLEWATEHNSFYAMPSVYLDSGGLDTDEPRWVAGWRHQMEQIGRASCRGREEVAVGCGAWRNK